MASLEGFEIKNVKTFEGREGIGLSCSIYLDGKRVIRYLDDAHGGMTSFDYLSNHKQDEQEIKELVEKRVQVFQQYNIFHSGGSVDTFVHVFDEIVDFLYELNIAQKEYVNEQMKQILFPFRVYTPKEVYSDDIRGIYYITNNYLESIQNLKTKHPDCWWLPITSIEDFNVTIKSFIK